MSTGFARDTAQCIEAHRAAVATMPLQLLNYSACLTAQEAATLEQEARRLLLLNTSQPWREEEAHAVMGDALRQAARTLGIDPDGLELRRARVQPAPAVEVDQRTKPRTVLLNDARWEKLQSLGSEWLERMLDAEPGA